MRAGLLQRANLDKRASSIPATNACRLCITNASKIKVLGKAAPLRVNPELAKHKRVVFSVLSDAFYGACLSFPLQPAAEIP